MNTNLFSRIHTGINSPLLDVTGFTRDTTTDS